MSERAAIEPTAGTRKSVVGISTWEGACCLFPFAYAQAEYENNFRSFIDKNVSAQDCFVESLLSKNVHRQTFEVFDYTSTFIT